MADPAATAPSVVQVTPADMPLYCPNPAMPLWSSHPRVFLDVGVSGEAMCPYCGTRYRLQVGTHDRLQGGPARHGH